MSERERMVDGSWYEEQYKTKGSIYESIYNKPVPGWAQEANRFHAYLVASWLSLPKQTRMLDLGSGVGRYMDVWSELGFDVRGVEVSATAVSLSKRQRGTDAGQIHVTNATDLSAWTDNYFDLVFSSAFLEHIAKEVTPQVIKETMRVARRAAHFIPLEAGFDPSHIHIQSIDVWVAELLDILGPGFVVFVCANEPDPTQPLFIICRRGDEPWALKRTGGGVFVEELG